MSAVTAIAYGLDYRYFVVAWASGRVEIQFNDVSYDDRARGPDQSPIASRKLLECILDPTSYATDQKPCPHVTSLVYDPDFIYVGFKHPVRAPKAWIDEREHILVTWSASIRKVLPIELKSEDKRVPSVWDDARWFRVGPKRLLVTHARGPPMVWHIAPEQQTAKLVAVISSWAPPTQTITSVTPIVGIGDMEFVLGSADGSVDAFKLTTPASRTTLASSAKTPVVGLVQVESELMVIHRCGHVRIMSLNSKDHPVLREWIVERDITRAFAFGSATSDHTVRHAFDRIVCIVSSSRVLQFDLNWAIPLLPPIHAIHTRPLPSPVHATTSAAHPHGHVLIGDSAGRIHEIHA